MEGLVGFYFGAFCILPIDIGYTTLFLLVHFNTTLFAYKNIPATFGVEFIQTGCTLLDIHDSSSNVEKFCVAKKKRK